MGFSVSPPRLPPTSPSLWGLDKSGPQSALHSLHHEQNWTGCPHTGTVCGTPRWGPTQGRQSPLCCTAVCCSGELSSAVTPGPQVTSSPWKARSRDAWHCTDLTTAIAVWPPVSAALQEELVPFRGRWAPHLVHRARLCDQGGQDWGDAVISQEHLGHQKLQERRKDPP